MKIEEWPSLTRQLVTLSFVFCVLVSAALLSLCHWQFSAIYLCGMVFWLLVERFQRCTRCCNYGTPCYCHGGSFARMIFRHREEVGDKNDDLVSFGLGGLLLLFPVLVLVFMAPRALGYWRFAAAAGHLLLSGAWLVLQQKQGCAKCMNTICTLYRE